MATIEPRLIHLLNESTTPQLSHTDLPPLHSLPLPNSPDRPLPPLGSDSSQGQSHRDRTERSGTDGQTITSSIAPLHLGNDEGSYRSRTDGSGSSRTEGKFAGNANTFPLRLLLGDTESAESSHSLSKILDDGSDALDDGSNKKRQRGLHVKDDFVQLPQPVKKQKAAQQALVMPPIINGLHEPPPHAALFPPISSKSFDEGDATQLNILTDFNHVSEEKQPAASTQASSEADKNSSKARKRATKPRRKWSEEETNHLLLGVNRHGVGKWTSILEDPDFRFNERTAGDLKDRFRTCCPDELRRSNRGEHADPKSSKQAKAPKTKSRTDTHLEKILIDSEDLSPAENDSPTANDGSDAPKQRKSRAHRKKMEDLAELGIHGPFKKSHRRERRPFTEQDDREILEGLDQYGPAWTKIQRDPRFHLASRQPTDLRDRVRNKYPNTYSRIEKGTFQIKDGVRGNDLMEPSINMSIDNSFKSAKGSAADPPMNRTNSREDLPRWPLQLLDAAETSQAGAGFDFGEATAPQFMGGEMDISRLLLDDSKSTPAPIRLGHDGFSGSSSPAGISKSHRDYGDNHDNLADRSKYPHR